LTFSFADDFLRERGAVTLRLFVLLAFALMLLPCVVRGDFRQFPRRYVVEFRRQSVELFDRQFYSESAPRPAV